jgi:hypothetical protein
LLCQQRSIKLTSSNYWKNRNGPKPPKNYPGNIDSAVRGGANSGHSHVFLEQIVFAPRFGYRYIEITKKNHREMSDRMMREFHDLALNYE